jgi:UDP-2-acetamido-2,6-beta-L-arabino-hexul-4-ose reductase
MIKVGITGQAGFIGTHLYNFFGLKKEGVTRIPFEDHYFADKSLLENFVRQCDVIIHLAALNRHNDPKTIYDTNITLVQQLIGAMENTGSTPYVLFSSSTQEERDNVFGQSKREGREMLTSWAQRNNALFTGMVIPNVFGPFGNPYYNSVIATFCHQLTHCEQPRIEVDATLKLIYIGELSQLIYDLITQALPLSDSPSPTHSIAPSPRLAVQHTSEHKVSEILELINTYKTSYFEKGLFPELKNRFEINLFNTFRCYMDIARHFPVNLTMNTDDRGTFVETVKTQLGGQVSFSTTKPGITRGNHFHTRKIERFAVIRGKARIQLRRIGTNEVMNFDLDGSQPGYVDMPVWYSHNITNTGTEDLYTLFWINEFFDPNDPDTYYEIV